MNRFKRVLIIFALLFILSGCSKVDYFGSMSEASPFVLVNKVRINRASWAIVYHEETKVMYLIPFVNSSGGITVLLNPDGTPMLYEE